jgi:DNA-binding GntR family transcriptional regulator
VLESLKDRDADGARRAMQEHVVRAGVLLARQFEEPATA